MFPSKSLLLKGLGGVGVLLGAGSLVIFREQIFGLGEEEEDLSGFNHRQLIEGVGLNCQLSDGETELADKTTNDCTVKDNGTINVEVEGKKEEGVKYSSNTSKLKVSKSGGYSGDLRFLVDSGDLTLTKDGTTPSISKLEQFETYEVKKVKDRFYLKRKTESKEEKGKVLGLGTCTLPKEGDEECSLTTEGIKKVKFQGQDSEGVTVASGTVNLKISKVSDSITDFTDNYRFTFTFPQEITINTKSLKANIPYDFKIKKGTGNSLTLEQAWESDNAFAKKAGLDCSNSTQCSVSSDSQKLNVKVGTQKKEGITSISTGKIKMETDQQGYNQGLKFSITTADVSLTGGTASGTGGDITKLEELETYEITEEGGKFYLSIKTSKEEDIKSSLSLPEGCELPLTGSANCSLDAESFKKINFDSKDSGSPSLSSGTATLTISKANSTDFPLGYKFTFSTTEDATIKANKNTIKANIPTDFKIKKATNGGNISLKRAWDMTTLGKKVGLTCDTGSKECTINAGNTLNVKQSDKSDTGLSKDNGSSDAKIKVTKDTQGYNQGFKFEIEGGNISLTGGTTTKSDDDKIKSLDEYETYEIKEEGDKWYLARKDEAIVFIKKALKIEEFCKENSFSTIMTCDISDVEKLKKIKFEGGTSHNWTTSTDPINVQMKIEKGSSLPGGFKFTFIDNGKKADLCLPTGTADGSVNLKDAAEGVEYQINKSGANNKTLSLVKKTP